MTSFTSANYVYAYHDVPSQITTRCQFRISVGCNSGGYSTQWYTAKTTTGQASCAGDAPVAGWSIQTRVV